MLSNCRILLVHALLSCTSLTHRTIFDLRETYLERNAILVRHLLFATIRDNVEPHDCSTDHFPPRVEMSSSQAANTQLLDFNLAYIDTHLSRLIVYLDLPLCWFLTAATLTGHAQQWVDHAFGLNYDDDLLVNSFFLCFGVWLVASHLLLLPLAILWEIWWNPYIYHPALRGNADLATEKRLKRENRAFVRELWDRWVG